MSMGPVTVLLNHRLFWRSSFPVIRRTFIKHSFWSSALRFSRLWRRGDTNLEDTAEGDETGKIEEAKQVAIMLVSTEDCVSLSTF